MSRFSVCDLCSVSLEIPGLSLILREGCEGLFHILCLGNRLVMETHRSHLLIDRMSADSCVFGMAWRRFSSMSIAGVF